MKDNKIKVSYIIESQKQFIRNICSIEKISSVQQLELYCLWNVDDEDFQVAFFEALLRYPFLRSVSIYTGYKITNSTYIDAVTEQGTFEVKVYKKQWSF